MTAELVRVALEDNVKIGDSIGDRVGVSIGARLMPKFLFACQFRTEWPISVH